MLSTDKIIVVKIGSDVLSTPDGLLSIDRIGELAKDLQLLGKVNYKVVLVISGAIAAGMGLLKQKNQPMLSDKQVIAGIGQAHLFSTILSEFKKFDLTVGQILLSETDIKTPILKRSMAKTLSGLLESGYIPVLNENDVISLNSFHGNDFLAGMIAKLIGARKLVILTNVDGFLDYSKESKKASVVPTIMSITPSVRKKVFVQKSQFGVGGMSTKLQVAESLQKWGIGTIIANGKTDRILARLLIHREKIGTHILCNYQVPPGKKPL